MGPDSFLDTRSKQILQDEIETYWSGTKQFLQEHPWSVNQVNLGQVDQDDVLSPNRLLLGCFSRDWPPLNDVPNT